MSDDRDITMLAMNVTRKYTRIMYRVTRAFMFPRRYCQFMLSMDICARAIMYNPKMNKHHKHRKAAFSDKVIRRTDKFFKDYKGFEPFGTDMLLNLFGVSYIGGIYISYISGNYAGIVFLILPLVFLTKLKNVHTAISRASKRKTEAADVA